MIKLIERAVLLDMPVADAIEEERELGELVTCETQTRTEDLLLPSHKNKVRPLRDIQKQYARCVWELYDRNYSAAARALGIKPNTLRYSYLVGKDESS